MGGFFTVVILIACVALILFVLVQNPKGGGLNSEFGSAIQLGGAKSATNILEKGTWGLAVVIGVMCLGMAAGGNNRTAIIDGEEDLDANSNTIELHEDNSGGAEINNTIFPEGRLDGSPSGE